MKINMLRAVTYQRLALVHRWHDLICMKKFIDYDKSKKFNDLDFDSSELNFLDK